MTTTHSINYATTVFDFIPTTDVTRTGNVTHLLSDDQECIELLRGFSHEDMRDTFGPGMCEYHDPGRGYAESEWMFKNKQGEIVGIGYRWGQSRIRGGSFLTKETAQRFIKLVRQKINIHRSCEASGENPCNVQLRAV